MLKTVIAAAVILRVIGLVNSPDLLLILTGGGPGEPGSVSDRVSPCSVRSRTSNRSPTVPTR